MMRLWVESYRRPASRFGTPTLSIGTLSAVAHAALIAVCVYATMPAADVPEDALNNRTFPQYMPPPDRGPGSGETRGEVVRYVELKVDGAGPGAGTRMMGEARPAAAGLDTAGRTQRDTAKTNQPPAPPPGFQDSVFSTLDVDTAAVRYANSAAPAYPLTLLQAHIMGSVSAQYIVDTTGFADTASFRVISATNPAFITAVREALPYMRFRPAKIGNLKVRQLVEQQFSFRINDTGVVAAPRKPPG